VSAPVAPGHVVRAGDDGRVVRSVVLFQLKNQALVHCLRRRNHTNRQEEISQTPAQKMAF